MSEPNNHQEDILSSETFHENIQRQKEFFDSYERKQPFDDWEGFLYHYNTLRASLASLRANPDTKDDPDFIELCKTWKHQQFGQFNPRLKELYYKLLEKPTFKENYIFSSYLYGSFVKSYYMLFNDECYTRSFFDID